MTTRHPRPKGTCQICGKEKDLDDLFPGVLVREAIVNEIRESHPDFDPAKPICQDDLRAFRTEHVTHLLAEDQGDLNELQQDVLRAIREHDLLSDEEVDLEGSATLGDRLSDRLADFGGSWPFLIIFSIVVAAWMAVNIGLAARAFDPYPFILLNLALSCLAAVQAPVIMMSQNRQDEKDRARAEHDYKVNLKAELEIRLVHEKLDRLLTHQWQRLLEIQQVQTDLMEQVSGRKT